MMPAVESLERRMMTNPFSQDSSQPFERKAQGVSSSTTTDDPDLSYLLDFAYRLKDPNRVRKCADWNRLDLKECVLNPGQLDWLQQTIFRGDNIDYGSREDLSILMRLLIRKAYNAGHNDFTFIADDQNTPNIIYTLGELDNPCPLRYRIFGTSGSPKHLENCIGVHHGDVIPAQFCGFNKQSRITIYGKVYEDIACDSQGCEYIFHGPVESPKMMFNAKDCTAAFYSDVNASFDIYFPKKCVFRTVSENMYERILRKLIRPDENKVQLITPEGDVLREG